MNYAMIHWVNFTPKVQEYGELTVVQETEWAIRFEELSSHFTKDARARALPQYAGVYASKQEAEAACVTKLEAKLQEFRNAAGKTAEELQKLQPKRTNFQQVSKSSKVLEDLEKCLRLYCQMLPPYVFEKLSQLRPTLHMQTAGILGYNMELVAYHYPGSPVEIPSLAFPDDLDDSQKANCEPLYRHKPTLVESST